MHYKLMFPSNFVSAADLDGKDVKATIESIKIEELTMEGGRKDKKPVIQFKGGKKKFILNKTNAKTIASMHGPETDQWVGKQITLYPTETRNGGETVPCLRVRAKE